MTLILTAVAALIVTALRFTKPMFGVRWQLGLLALLYWGATAMWCVDGIAALTAGEPFVELANPEAVLDDTWLGLSVVALGLVAWAIYLLINRRSRSAVHS